MYQINWGDLTPEIFLKEYWQKKPLFIRGAISNDEGFFVVPIDADELAGLAMEEDIESRIVGQKVVNDTAGDWYVEHGPFDDFSKFGEEYWTLLVQATNNWSSSTQAMLAPFRFIPNWRIDDVMVSFSTPHGGVGPHLDQYDVFIIQGQGKRRWQVGAPDSTLETLIPHEDLKQLSPFTPIIDEITQTGDLLYIPPNHPHNGVSIENSVNYSIGFQAPSNKELWSGFADNIIDKNLGEQRFGDADRTVTSQPETITANDFEALKAFMLSSLQNEAAFNQFMCEHLTRSHHTLDILEPEDDDELFTKDSLADMLSEAQAIAPINGLKSLYNDVDKQLYINGEQYDINLLPLPFVIAIAKNDAISIDELKQFNLDDDSSLFLINLLNQGLWFFV